jgi:hypothetical protein
VADDRAVVSAQIGRPSRAPADVVVRCHLGLPVVTRMPPRLEDGTPFPTRYWLTCPLAVLRIGRLEGHGGVTRAQEWLDADPDRTMAMAAAHRRYAADRGEGEGGVGGIKGDGVKCLHAHYGDHLAGNDNPVGEWTAPQVGELDCAVPCVADSEPNPQWREP